MLTPHPFQFLNFYFIINNMGFEGTPNQIPNESEQYPDSWNARRRMPLLDTDNNRGFRDTDKVASGIGQVLGGALMGAVLRGSRRQEGFKGKHNVSSHGDPTVGTFTEREVLYDEAQRLLAEYLKKGEIDRVLSGISDLSPDEKNFAKNFITYVSDKGFNFPENQRITKNEEEVLIRVFTELTETSRLEESQDSFSDAA